MLDDERAVVVVVVRLAMPPPGRLANPVGAAVVAGVAVVLGAAVVVLGAAVVLDDGVDEELTVTTPFATGPLTLYPVAVGVPVQRDTYVPAGLLVV